MADILGVVFRRFAPGTGTSDLVFPSRVEGNTLVLGDVNIRRSVLFLSAVTAASDLGLKVLFFTQTPFQSLPVSVRDSVPGLKLDSLKNVKFVYVKTLEELVEDVASLHELASDAASPPSLIIVDGLERYLQGPLQDDPGPVARVAALLHDTAAFLTQILQNRADGQGLCRVMLSFQSECEGSRDSEVPDLLLSVLDRYLQVRCTFEEMAGQNEWQVYLSDTSPSSAHQGQQWHVGLQAGGVLEFRPVIGEEQQILDQRDKSKQGNESK
ncbi:ATPase SWSAP1 [Pimephales promelas]|uniref:ATPase SWSAP1 n=1 Tax=Pimephales promelas TaxID=90988 RepID=UPI001955C0B6|nr:ATPase SWSAP1 [Pimephales promelas]KAG1931476.1 ATPase SWSAP1 [Pimephales promelas]